MQRLRVIHAVLTVLLGGVTATAADPPRESPKGADKGLWKAHGWRPVGQVLGIWPTGCHP